MRGSFHRWNEITARARSQCLFDSAACDGVVFCSAMATEKPTLVPAVSRAFHLLELLSDSKRGLTISEAGRRLQVPKSSAFRLIKALEDRGYIQRSGNSGRYRFGLTLVALSRSALENLELRDEAKPFLIALMQKTGLTVHLAVLREGQAVIVEKIEAPGPVKIGTWVGRAMDVNSTAVGKALIALLPPDELNRHLKASAFVRHNQRTISSLTRLKQELSQVRRQGYAVDDEEDELGMRCVGAPIVGDDGAAIAAISVVGTVAQVPRERLETLTHAVRQFAAVISSVLR